MYDNNNVGGTDHLVSNFSSTTYFRWIYRVFWRLFCRLSSLWAMYCPKMWQICGAITWRYIVLYIIVIRVVEFSIEGYKIKKIYRVFWRLFCRLSSLWALYCPKMWQICGAITWRYIVVYIMATQVVEFSNGGYKIRKIFALKSTCPKEILNFENWCSGEVSNLGVILVCNKVT